jgi:hypothetical protein
LYPAVDDLEALRRTPDWAKPILESALRRDGGAVVPVDVVPEARQVGAAIDRLRILPFRSMPMRSRSWKS